MTRIHGPNNSGEHSNVAYYSIPQMGGGYSVRYKDGSLETCYGILPDDAFPCIRFDLSTDEAVNAWRKEVSRVWKDPMESLTLAERVGCNIDRQYKEA